MKRFAGLSAITAFALTIPACKQTADTHDADVKTIQSDETLWNLDLASKDVDKIMTHYADDAVLMGPGMKASSGKNAIRNAINEMVSDPMFSLKFQSARVEVAKSGDIAYTQGSYTITMKDPKTRQLINDHGSYVTTYRKQPDGTWKAVADIATSEVPPAAPPSTPPLSH